MHLEAWELQLNLCSCFILSGYCCIFDPQILFNWCCECWHKLDSKGRAILCASQCLYYCKESRHNEYFFSWVNSNGSLKILGENVLEETITRLCQTRANGVNLTDRYSLQGKDNTFKVLVAMVKILSSVEWHNGSTKLISIFVPKNSWRD